MTIFGPERRFDYMHWAKTAQPRARFNLGGSAMPPRSWEDLFEQGIPAVPLSATDAAYGLSRLASAIAQRYAVAPDNVAVVPGTSAGNYYAMGSILRAGDRVLLERPSYTVFDKIAATFRVAIDWVDRFHGVQEYHLDLEQIAATWRPGTKLLVLTNNNNPSGAVLTAEELLAIHDFVAKRNAYLLLDEVYQEFMADRQVFPSSALLLRQREPSHAIITNSPTKVYGLGALRVGWVLGNRKLIEGVHAFQDLVCPEVAHPIQAWAAQIIPRLDALNSQSRPMIDRSHDVLQQWLVGQPRVHIAATRGAGQLPFVFARLEGIPNTDAFCRRLLDRERVLVNPGEFYQQPGWVRIGITAPEADLIAGLELLGRSMANDV
jgi:aspartate/methionine/tyrosine aminotransferase